MTAAASQEHLEALAGLQTRAAELEAIVERCLVDPHGVVLAAVDTGSLRPHSKEVFTPGTDIMRHPAMKAKNFGDYFAYENCGMCTGSYLAAMVWKHRAEGDPASLENARRSFRAIDHIYRISQQIEPGFFCKYHEAQPTTEMSTDQCMYAMVGLDLYASLANNAERRRIGEIIGGIAGMWMRKKYRHPYRDRDYDWPWPLNRFPVMMWLAWRHTGDAAFHAEFLRLAALPEVAAAPPYCSGTHRGINTMARAHRAQLGTLNDFFWPFSLEGASSAETALDPLLRDEAPGHDLWLGQLRDAVESARPKLGKNLLERGHCRYDPASGNLTEVELPYYVGGKPNPIWQHKYYAANVQSGHSPPMYARALVAAGRHLPDQTMLQTAIRILRALDLRDMAWKHDPLDHLPENQKWLTRTLSVDAVTNWLWAYWMAVADGKSC